jgi:hypothetical protein
LKGKSSQLPKLWHWPVRILHSDRLRAGKLDYASEM